MAHRGARLGDELVDPADQRRQRLDLVVHEVDLAAAPDFLPDGLRQHLLAKRDDVGLDRGASRGRRLDDGQVAHAGERHLQRARDRRCGHRQHVDADRQLLQLFFVRNPEALLFVDDEQAEFLELDVFGQQAVGADQHVHRADFEILEGLADLGGGAEARHHLHAYRKRREAAAERFVMLYGQDGRGREHRDLTPVHHGFEGRADGDFGLAESDVADQQPVGRPVGLHVLLDLAQGALLVRCEVERERCFEFLLPGRILAESVAANRASLGVQLQQIACHRLDRLAHPFLDALPPRTAELVGLGHLPGDAAVFLDKIQAIDRDEQPVAPRELEHHEVAVEAAALGPAEPEVARHAVIDVNDVIAFFEIAKVREKRAVPAGLRFRAAFGFAEQIAFGQHDQPRLRELVARAQRSDADQQPASLFGGFLQVRRQEVVLVEDLA